MNIIKLINDELSRRAKSGEKYPNFIIVAEDYWVDFTYDIYLNSVKRSLPVFGGYDFNIQLDFNPNSYINGKLYGLNILRTPDLKDGFIIV